MIAALRLAAAAGSTVVLAFVVGAGLRFEVRSDEEVVDGRERDDKGMWGLDRDVGDVGDARFLLRDEGDEPSIRLLDKKTS